jgi:hypothetical protein
MKRLVKLFLLIVLLCMILACGSNPDANPDPGPDNNNADPTSTPPSSDPCPETGPCSILSDLCSKLDGALPSDWQSIETFPIDANNDRSSECVIFYRFDMPSRSRQGYLPIGSVIYQLDGKRPPCVIPFELKNQDGGHLCEHDCHLAMEDVLSKPEDTPEIVVRDEYDGETVRVSIFRWIPDIEPDGGYQSWGHFFGDRITVEKDKVTLDRRLPDRARLAMRHTYVPQEIKLQGKVYNTYYDVSNNMSEGFLMSARKFEMIFYHGEPEHVMLSPYPEKIVLAFYNHYTNAQEASKYWTETGWEQERYGGDGCTAQRSEISDVRVIHLEPINETYSYAPCQECEDQGPDQAIVKGSVICERQNGSSANSPTLHWQLVREDSCWKLNSVDEQ